MPVQQHSTTRPEASDSAADAQRGKRGDSVEPRRVPVETVERVDDAPSGLSSQIERARLRARIRALERELAARERRHEEIVRQYERILEDRSAETGDGRQADSASLFDRLFGTDR